mmetsp:Transcript_25399/g.28252  ORF Transcript_25399/g.28252 Transcript_25399/m.28252 type:complete len:287 (+) Transcript_25399:269-1129(+)
MAIADFNKIYTLDLTTGELIWLGADDESTINYNRSTPLDTYHFSHPFGLAIDKNDRMVVSNSYYHTVVDINLSLRTVQCLAGKHNDGLSSSQGTLSYPYGVCFTSDGSIIVSDLRNQCIKKISNNGHITKVAGLACDEGEESSNIINADFEYPTFIVADPITDDIYVRDGCSLRVISNGTIETLYINPIGDIKGLALDSRGNLYFVVEDVYSDGICKMYIKGEHQRHIVRLHLDPQFDNIGALHFCEKNNSEGGPCLYAGGVLKGYEDHNSDNATLESLVRIELPN